MEFFERVHLIVASFDYGLVVCTMLKLRSGSEWIQIILRSRIRLRIRVKSRIWIRIKVKRVCRPKVADLVHFYEEQDKDPDPDQSEKHAVHTVNGGIVMVA
jgi:hypothetical protein